MVDVLGLHHHPIDSTALAQRIPAQLGIACLLPQCGVIETFACSLVRIPAWRVLPAAVYCRSVIAWQRWHGLLSHSMKTTDDYFTDWQSHYIGYGYGTGEPHVFEALKRFFHAVSDDGGYHYQVLEEACTPAVAWLLISILARADIIDYGTSARNGWLTENGKALAEYIRGHSVEELVQVTDRDENYVQCFPDYCNCVAGKDEGCRKLNPFWKRPY